MIHHFATYEEAGIYAAWMRSEGHYSAILDEHMGFIYGPLAIGGFRVLVSDEPVDEDQAEPPANSPQLDHVSDGIRLVVLAFVALGLLTWLIFAIKYPNRYAVDAIAWTIRYLLLLAVMCGLSPLMIPMTRSLRAEHSVFGRCVRALVVLHIAFQVFVMLGMFVYALWCEAHRHYH